MNRELLELSKEAHEGPPEPSQSDRAVYRAFFDGFISGVVVSVLGIAMGYGAAYLLHH